ncbi:MAG TPA: flagella basal body P-ring formation protein FlgA [Bryobacteraceae bacterium]|nr:flagella basal body P-ring formation protein FlgA [Bryobacteraceae bacterium]
MKYALALLAAVPAWACIPVEADRIFAKDLAEANADFASLDPSVEIGFSPRAGVTRVFEPGDLAAIARRFNVTASGGFERICVVRPASASPPRSAPAGFDIQRGQKVAVEVTSGAARLRFDADAESSGRAGDTVLIRNPENGRLFQARVEGKGKVVVQR